ncbi:unnamed protein product [Chironomus riparius]|uniref:Regulatory protein zeste n=1 Tax=Chironomus riparius TaxID=315576 RepID=A0A9N9WR93_9DIPT|nr:unnamed protein product [Chironomus riparius]
MNESASRKRNRSDNFDVDDVELLLGLVNEHTDMLDSPKIETKKEGWDIIHTKFNANCTGIKRDLNALKSKIKNLKAQSKKVNLKLETSQQDPLASNDVMNGDNGNDTNDEYEMDVSQTDEDTKPIISHCSSNGSNKTRKRCKKFTKEECDLLLSLHEKYCANLDTSSTANSVKKRQEAWDNLTYEFNDLQSSGVTRECNELKIKYKNIKALKVKTEPMESQTIVNNMRVFNESDSSSKAVVEDRKIISTRPIRSLQNPAVTKTFAHLANSTATNDMFYDDDDYEEDFNHGNHKQPTHEDKEVEKVRRENILLKNAVLRKKERLLELQIALAERNLRRQL